MIANYTATRLRKFITLYVSPTDRTLVEVIAVSGKTEARRIAAERGAKCWNF